MNNWVAVKIWAYLTEHEEATAAEMINAAVAWSGSIYPTLYEMEEAGDITSRWEGEGYPRRKLYRRCG